MSQPEITMYTRPGCPDVARAAQYLSGRGMTWKDIDIEAVPAAREQVIAWTGRAVTPVVLIGDSRLIEPDEAELAEALAKAA